MDVISSEESAPFSPPKEVSNGNIHIELVQFLILLVVRNEGQGYRSTVTARNREVPTP